MKLSKQLFTSCMKKPNDYANRKTSSLLENGIFTYFRNPGIPFYLPLGKRVLNKMQDIFLEEAENSGMSPIEIPGIMKDEVLEEGEEIVDTFNRRIVRLNNDSLGGYHLLTTPEPMMLDLASVSLNAYTQLPIRFVYNVDVVRGVQDPKGMLKGRQFKTFMGNSLDENKESLEESLRLFEQISDNIFRRLGIPVYKRRDPEKEYTEYFYFGPEGDNLVMPEINPVERVKALSLAMAYHYDPKKRTKARFRNRQNKNSQVLYGTYGLGTQRAFYSLFDSHKDERGFNLPRELTPFQFSIIPVNLKDCGEAERLYESIKNSALLDDRGILFGERAELSDYIGVPWKIIYGNGSFTLRSRDKSINKAFNSREELTRYLKREIK